MERREINDGNTIEINDENIQRLKDKYSKELKYDDNNPMKVCIKLVFDAATNKDSCRRSEISYKLSEFLIKPDGLINLFLALIDFDSSSQKVTTHNQRYIAVANIITCLPTLCLPYEEYCLSIIRQLKPLLISDNVEYSNLACIITKSMLESPHAKDKNVHEVIINPIIQPLIDPQGKNSFWNTSEAILIIDRLIQKHLPEDLFIDLLPSIFYALLTLKDTLSRLKKPLKRILLNLLNHLKPGPACCQLEKTLFYYPKNNHSYKISTIGEDVGIEFCDERGEYEIPSVVELVLSLLQQCDNYALVLEFFFHFNETMWSSSKDHEAHRLNIALVDELLSNAIIEDEKQTSNQLTNGLDLMGIIACKPITTIELINKTLMNHLGFLKSDQRDFLEQLKLVQGSMNSCLQILEIILATLAASGQVHDLQVTSLPILELSDLFEKHQNSCKDHKTFNGIKSLINQLKSSSFSHRDDDQSFAQDLHVVRMKAEYASILKDLNDKLEPVRVHGLVRLKQLIQGNELAIVSKIPTIYPIIESSLADPEPYVFLAGIKLLAEMSIRRTQEILPKLTDLYLRDQLLIQNRLNVGEVLVQLSKQIGEMTPIYAQQVLSVFLEATSSSDELMRVSSLTNIGEICKNLGDSLGKYILEILACVTRVVASDTIEVKCAAVDLLRTTLSGLDRLRVESIQQELKSIYQLLKQLKGRTLDDNLCLQIDLALDEMDRIAKALILGVNSGDKLEKNIKLLSL